jgi:hypothetical protein
MRGGGTRKERWKIKKEGVRREGARESWWIIIGKERREQPLRVR